MQQQTDVWAFLIETYKRMSLKSPHYFQVVQTIGTIAALISGIPLAIQQFELATGAHIDMPELTNGIFIRVLFWCGILTKIIAKLPVTDPAKPVDAQGLVQSKHDVMPFTQKKKEETPVVPLNNPNQGA